MSVPECAVITSDNFMLVPSFHALVTFKRNDADGTLTLIEEYRSADGLQGPVGIAAWPEGCLLVAGAKDNAISSYNINNLATGLLIYKYRQTDGGSGIFP